MIEEYGKVLNDVSLKQYTSYRLSEKAKKLIIVNDINKLTHLLDYIKKNNIKYKIIGGGSNLIFDGDYDGILIKLELESLIIKDNKIIVGAGYNLMKLSIKLSKLGYTGLEFASGIPGTVGGAVVNNSGAYKSDMGYIIKKVLVLTPFLELKEMYNKDLEYHYRSSYFKTHSDYIVLEATIELKKGNKNEIIEVINDRKRRRIEAQPLEYPSAGSVFRNPPDDYAGRLIEDIGYKGYNINDAMVSTKHANFIINKGTATGKDIIKLIVEIKKKVKEKHNIDLILEQEIVR